MSQQPQQWLTVWKLRFDLELRDPDTVGTRYHTTIFIETNPTDGSGFIHHVIGDVTRQQGMEYAVKSSCRPEEALGFDSKDFLGYAAADTYPARWETCLRSVPPPPRQKAFNMATMRTEPVKTWDPLTFYAEGEDRRPLFKCTEWTEQRAIPALCDATLIRKNDSRAGVGAKDSPEPAPLGHH